MKILVAMDDSDFARYALKKAIELSKFEPSDVYIITVIPQIGAIDELSPRMAEKFREQGEVILENSDKLLKEAGIQAKKMVIESGVSPAENIITFAQENNIDLIVIGYRGKAKLEKLILGSVAFRVITQSHCSVLVVK